MEEKPKSEDKNLPKHHIRQELCETRPLYRRGKKLTAIKAYSINHESQHLLIYGVPALNLSKELYSLCFKYGEIKKFEKVINYDTEQFTECYHCNYKRIQSARIAKKFLDDKSFYGGVLHVCYAPEYETVTEVKDKIHQRLKDVASRRDQHGPVNLEYINLKPEEVLKNRKRKHPALPITEKRLRTENTDNIWEGIPSELDPRLRNHPYQTNKNIEIKKHFQMESSDPMYGPFQVKNPISSSSDINLETVEVPQPSTSGLENKNSIVGSTLMPSTVIKNYKEEYNKRIMFRKKVIKNS